MAEAPTAGDPEGAAIGPAAARRSIRVSAGTIAGALGPPAMVVEVSYLTWTEDGLLRHVVYLREREDKPAREVVRSVS